MEGLLAALTDGRRVLWRVGAVEDDRPTGAAARRAREALGEAEIALHDLLRRPPEQHCRLLPAAD